MKMMKKKGWLRIVEAFMAILIIAGVVFVILGGKIPKINKPEEIYNLQRAILDEISARDDLREAVLKAEDSYPEDVPDGKINMYDGGDDYNALRDFVLARVPKNFEEAFEIQICLDINEVCALDEYRDEVYVNERVISSTLEIYKPRKLKLFMWEK